MTKRVFCFVIGHLAGGGTVSRGAFRKPRLLAAGDVTAWRDVRPSLQAGWAFGEKALEPVAPVFNSPGVDMKIGCHCGATIYDQTDDLPQKGHLIPDQEWFATYDAMDDEVIKPLVAGTLGEEKAFMLSRGVISRAARLMYQCSVCGRLYIEEKNGTLHCYTPRDEDTSKEILRSR